MFFSKIQPPCGFPVFWGNSLYFPPCPSTKDTTFPTPDFPGLFRSLSPKDSLFSPPDFHAQLLKTFSFLCTIIKYIPVLFSWFPALSSEILLPEEKFTGPFFPLSFRFMDRVDRPFSLHHFQWNQYEREEPHHGICWNICRSLGADLQLLPRAHHRSCL